MSTSMCAATRFPTAFSHMLPGIVNVMSLQSGEVGVGSGTSVVVGIGDGAGIVVGGGGACTQESIR